MTVFKPIVRNANTRLAAERRAAGLSVWSADIDDRTMEVVDLDVRVADDVPDDIQIAFGPGPLLVRDRVYVVDGRRVQWARSYIPMSIAVGTRIEVEDTGPGGTLARLAEQGWAPTLFVEDMEVGFPDDAERLKLGIGTHDPVCRIDRIALANDDAVEFTVMTLVAAAYKFRSTIVA